MRTPIIATVALCLFAGTARAQEKASTDDLYVDFAIPDVPALGLFGLNPQKVSRPGNLKEFSLAVLPIAGTGKDIGSGAAFAWAPVYTFAHSVDAYRGPLLRRLSFSGATVKDKSTSAINVGVGLRVVAYDGSDPVMSSAFQTQIEKVLASYDEGVKRRNVILNEDVEPMLAHVAARLTPDRSTQNMIEAELVDVWNIQKPPTPLTETRQVAVFKDAIDASVKKHELPMAPQDIIDHQVDVVAAKYVDVATGETSLADIAQRITKALAKTRKQFMDSHWNAPVVAVDVGNLFTSTAGTWGDLTAQQFGGSLSAAAPIGSVGGHAQLVSQVQARRAIGTGPKERTFYSAGARALVGGPTKRLSLEGLWSKTNSTDATVNGTSKRVTVGAEFRVVEAFWVEVALGAERTPSTAAGTSLVSLANIKYAFKSSPRFSRVPGAAGDDSK